MSDYYIDGAVGNDSNAGTSEGSGNAWATIGKAISNPIVAGDRVFVKASATYSENPNFNAISGTMADPIVVEGYSSSVGDGGRATIVGDAASTDVLTSGVKYSIRNFSVSGGSSLADSRGINADSDSVVENCEVDGESVVKRGFDGNLRTYHVGCYSHDCVTNGLRFFGVGGAFACLADTCAAGLQNNVATFGYFYCIARGNTGFGLSMNSNSGSEPIVNCTVDGLDGAGAKGIENGTSGDLAVVINCVAINCNSGITMSSSASSARNWSFNNCLFGNTSNYTNGETVSGEILADPEFVDESAKDYGPDTDSPLIAAGYDARGNVWLPMTGDPIDVGALQSLAGGPNFAGAFLNWGVN